MVSPPRAPVPSPAVDQWTETDQEIIESLLMVDGSARNHPPAQPPAQPSAHASHEAAASLSSVPILSEPPRGTRLPVVHPAAPSNVAYAGPLPPAASARPPTLVPVAYWVPAQPAQPYYTHSYTAVQPTFFSQGVPRQSSVEMELQEILSEEERKAKHREVQRRFVQRKKEQMDRIRREAARLEKRHSYLRLNLEQLALEKQNSELQGQLDDADDVRVPTADEINLVLDEECRAAQEGFEPISENDFSELLRDTMEAVGETVIKDPRKLDERSKVQVMGWTGRRVLETGSDNKAAMRFEISKQFARITPRQIVNRTWAEITSPAGYRRFFSPSTLMKMVTLQRVNDDAVVTFKTIFNPRTAAVQHSVDLMCRIEINDEMLIISRDLHVPAVRESIRDPKGWCRSLNVLGFGTPKATTPGSGVGTPTSSLGRSDPSTAFRYNCCVQGTSEANLRYWLMEILFVMIRFEAMLVAPLFALTAP